MTHENYIRAFFKKSGIDTPGQALISAFEEAMSEELRIADWIAGRDQQFLLKVLTKAAAKANTKPAPKKDKPAVTPPTTPASQPTQPAFKLGGQP